MRKEFKETILRVDEITELAQRLRECQEVSSEDVELDFDDLDFDPDDDEEEQQVNSVPVGWLCINCSRINSPHMPYCTCQDEIMIKAKFENRRYLK